MKKYEILRKEYFQAPNGDLMISDNIVLNDELSFGALGVFMTMARIDCIGKEITDTYIKNKFKETVEEIYNIFQELIEKKYIKEI